LVCILFRLRQRSWQQGIEEAGHNWEKSSSVLQSALSLSTLQLLSDIEGVSEIIEDLQNTKRTQESPLTSNRMTVFKASIRKAVSHPSEGRKKKIQFYLFI
jgi:hypothetical protein